MVNLSESKLTGEISHRGIFFTTLSEVERLHHHVYHDSLGEIFDCISREREVSKGVSIVFFLIGCTI